MSRFSPCRETTLDGVVKDCAGKCMNRGVAGNCPCTEHSLSSFPDVGSSIPTLLGGARSISPRPTVATGISTDPWTSETADPPGGSTYYAEINPVNSSVLSLVGGFSCAPLFAFAYTTVLSAGDMVSCSYQAKKAGSYLSKTVQPEFQFDFRDVDGTVILTHFVSTANVTTSYVSRSTSRVAPAATKYVLVQLSRGEGGSGGYGGDALLRYGDIVCTIV